MLSQTRQNETPTSTPPSTPPSKSASSPSSPAGNTPSCKAYRPSIATMSLGQPGIHPLDKKLAAAAARGFQGVEIYWDDLVAHAKLFDPQDPLGQSGDDALNMMPAARHIRALCDELGLQIISLQPFRNYDGIIDPVLHQKRLAEFAIWLDVADVLKASVIGVPATIDASPATHTDNSKTIVRDLVELAALAEPHGVRLAYENLCFGAHVQSWQHAWEMVRRTDRLDTVVFLPDTFNICGDVFADPTRPDGTVPAAHEALSRSLDECIATVPPSSVPFLQVADAELLAQPLTPEHPWLRAPGVRNAKMAWSRHARLFPLEEGGYLPIVAVVEALVKTGWVGWVSMEVFSRTTEGEGERTILRLAERAWKSWEALAGRMGWEVRP
ncbi:hypothetical protein G7046_g18 [Stylonectria norvegica]|nr:hypothetical protein G7046_g18 [Stylonectria norvegica]